MDYKSWNVGEKFLGLKMIPPGIHFVYFSVKDAPRIGFFYNFQPQEIIMRKWDKGNEDISNYKENSEEVLPLFFHSQFANKLFFQVQRIRSNLKNIDSNLGPYPYSTYRQWVSLTSFITEKTILRLQPDNSLGRITSQTELMSKESELEKQLACFLG